MESGRGQASEPPAVTFLTGLGIWRRAGREKEEGPLGGNILLRKTRTGYASEGLPTVIDAMNKQF